MSSLALDPAPVPATPRSYPPQPRLSTWPESSTNEDYVEQNIPTPVVAHTSTLQSLETLASKLNAIATDSLVGSNSAALRHRLAQVPVVLRDQVDVLDDVRMAKPLARLRHALGQVDVTMRRARHSFWLGRRSRFKQQVRIDIDDVGDAIALVRVGAVQIRSTMGVSADPTSTTTTDPASKAELAFLMGDRHRFGHNATRCDATARRYYEIASSGGDYAPALNSLGLMHRDGRGGGTDVAKALELFERAAQLGSVDAVHNLAAMQLASAETPTKVVYAIELLRMAAAADHMEAATMLGWLHERGDCKFDLVEQDAEAAQQWYQMAADLGYDKAQNNLAHLLFKQAIANGGRDAYLIQQTLASAAVLFRQSADQGNAAAINNLAICTEVGAGVECDAAAAERLYARASDLGNVHAAANVGRLLMQRKQYRRARHYLQKAVLDVDSQPSAAAFVLLGELYMVGRDAGVGTCPTTAYEQFSKGAKMGHRDGQFQVAQMLFSGVGVGRDVDRAFELYKASALQGCAGAQNALGVLLEESIPSVQDFDQARYWYEKAAAQNHGDALCNLGAMYENGAGVEVDLPKAISLYQHAKENGSVAACMRLVDLNR